MNNEEQGLLPMNELMSRSGIEELEKEMLNMEQVECPVVHKFAPGLYIREMFIPKGVTVIGHLHKTSHLNNMLCGKILTLDDDGQVVVLEPPLSSVTRPCRKLAHALEDTIWQNVFATDETDVDKLEEILIEKSVTFIEHRGKQMIGENLQLSEINIINREDDV